MSKTVKLIDLTLRDAHQCLWATRMTTGMMRDVAPLLDRAGFEAIDLVGGAVFDVCVRYLHEDPWERMRILSEWVTETPLIIHTRGQSLFTFEFFADDVVELAAERFVANGMRYHTPYDALNDIRNLEIPVRKARALGLHTVPGLVYTTRQSTPMCIMPIRQSNWSRLVWMVCLSRTQVVCLHRSVS